MPESPVVIQTKVAEIELMLDGDFVIFAIATKAMKEWRNLQEIKRYINQQKEIIYYYREATAPKGVDGWLEENKERQDNQEEAVKVETKSWKWNLRKIMGPNLKKLFGNKDEYPEIVIKLVAEHFDIQRIP